MAKKISFKEFVASSGPNDFRKIALEYATENDSVTIEKIAERHNMTVGSIKQIFSYTIVNCLVSYHIAILMKEKAHRNQCRHIEKITHNTSSDKYYNNLLAKRLKTIKNFSDERVRDIVNLYISSPTLSAKEVAYSIGLSKNELNVVLSKAIIFNIVDDETVVKMNRLALYRVLSKKEQIIFSEVLEQYSSLRQFYKALINKIEALKFQIQTYEEFASSSDDIEKLKADAEKEFKKANKSLADFNASFFK